MCTSIERGGGREGEREGRREGGRGGGKDYIEGGRELKRRESLGIIVTSLFHLNLIVSRWLLLPSSGCT